MELVFHHAMEKYKDLITIQKESNHLYRFYHKSGKRELDLATFASTIGETVVKLNKIITTRYVIQLFLYNSIYTVSENNQKDLNLIFEAKDNSRPFQNETF